MQAKRIAEKVRKAPCLSHGTLDWISGLSSWGTGAGMAQQHLHEEAPQVTLLASICRVKNSYLPRRPRSRRITRASSKFTGTIDKVTINLKK